MLPSTIHMRREGCRRAIVGFSGVLVLVMGLVPWAVLAQEQDQPLFHDGHFHLTNYAQEGTDIHDYLAIMGTTIGRSTIFGLPLQQMWSYANTGDFAPYYYLQSDAPLYYYSFTDAHIAMAYKSLSPEQQARIDPMITGFNPADMYAADHIRRVLLTFPGVFSGVGEFTIHKEFVSSKVAGEVASLTNPALDRIFDFCAEVGLPIILHNDINMPFPKPDQEPYMLRQMKDLFERHPDAVIIWAHLGLGRVVRPLEETAQIIETICTSPSLSHVMLDISWDETAKYATSDPGDHPADRRHDQQVPRALHLRLGLRGPHVVGFPDGGLPRLEAGPGSAHPGGAGAGAQGQLRADLRRGPAAGQGLGGRQRRPAGARPPVDPGLRGRLCRRRAPR